MRTVVWRVVFTCVLVLAGGPPRAAMGAAETTCTFEYEVAVSPSNTPNSGTVSSDGERGTSRCNGPVHGYQPTGEGTAGFEGTVHGNRSADCRAGSGDGDGVQALTLPTEGGNQHVTNRLTYTYQAQSGGERTGEFRGDQMSGTFRFKPIEGNCATRPVRRFRVTGKGTLFGG